MGSWHCYGDCSKCIALKLLGEVITKKCGKNPPREINPDTGIRFSMSPSELRR